jgi:hypothetical protein
MSFDKTVNTGSVTPLVSTSLSTDDEFAPQKASRSVAKLRLAIDGVSGSGKTYSALLIAMGLGGRIVVIDTENKSAGLYAHLGDFDVVNLAAPFSPQRMMTAINKMEELGYDIIIIDSFSAVWASAGGALEMQSVEAARGGNSYVAWAPVTKVYNKLIDTILDSPKHIIVTMRTKMEYVIDKDISGKTTIRKCGMQPIQRAGVEFEFTTVFDIGQDHSATVSKDRTGLFDGRNFVPDKKTGAELGKWLNGTD